jgi:hypothetical protein
VFSPKDLSEEKEQRRRRVEEILNRRLWLTKNMQMTPEKKALARPQNEFLK